MLDFSIMPCAKEGKTPTFGESTCIIKTSTGDLTDDASDSMIDSTGVGICSTLVCTLIFDGVLACFFGDSDFLKKDDEKLVPVLGVETGGTCDGAEGATLGDSKSPGSLSFLL